MKVARSVDIPWRENNFFKVEKNSTFCNGKP